MKQSEDFVEFFETPTKETFQSLIKNNTGETSYLDFKESWVTFPKLAKHILAFSNTGGGAIVIGVKENDDGILEPVGIGKLLDKDKINKGLIKYLPTRISWEVLDFTYDENKLKGMKFQALLVEYDSQLIPFLCLKAGDGIKEKVVYVRNGTSTTEATHDDLQRIINKRIYSFSHDSELSVHLQQLEELHKIEPLKTAVMYATKWNGEDYYDFVCRLVERKKQKIIEVLAL